MSEIFTRSFSGVNKNDKNHDSWNLPANVLIDRFPSWRIISHLIAQKAKINAGATGKSDAKSIKLFCFIINFMGGSCYNSLSTWWSLNRRFIMVLTCDIVNPSVDGSPAHLTVSFTFDFPFFRPLPKSIVQHKIFHISIWYSLFIGFKGRSGSLDLHFSSNQNFNSNLAHWTGKFCRRREKRNGP